MPDNDHSQPKGWSSDLRSRAEAIPQEQDASSDNVAKMSVDEIENLIHELRVHQIELELQNQDLREAQFELSKSRDDYVDLYDLAPVGYLTVSDKGRIVRANLTAAKLLGIDRQLLLNKALSSCVVPEDRDKYYLHRIH